MKKILLPQWIPWTRSRKFLCSSTLALPVSLLLSTTVKAQNQSVIAAAGDNSSNGKIALEWTVGEVAVETAATGKNMYTEGFHQPLVVKKAVLLPVFNLLPDYFFTVAPNPVISELTVTISDKIVGKVQLQLADLYGRPLTYVSPSLKRTFRFSLQNQPAGTYYLSIRNEKGEVLKTFSIIK